MVIPRVFIIFPLGFLLDLQGYQKVINSRLISSVGRAAGLYSVATDNWLVAGSSPA